MNSTTMTFRLPVELHDKLTLLSEGTRRSRSFLATEALARYVERELAIVEGIQQGLDDVAAGRTTPHEEVMDELRAIIDEAERAKSAQR